MHNLLTSYCTHQPHTGITCETALDSMNHREERGKAVTSCPGLELSACHLCLHQLHALASHALQEAVQTESTLSLHLLHHGVQQDEGAGAAHARTAVHQQRGVQAGRVQLAHSADEGDDRHGIAGHSVVWPGRVMEVSDCEVTLCLRDLTSGISNTHGHVL